MQGAKKKVRSVSYAKWGYVFIAPFFIVFALFQLYPLVSTIYYSFFEYFFKQGGLIQVGPKFVGWTNYLYVFSKDLPILRQHHHHVADGLHPADYLLASAGGVVHR